MCVCVCMHVCSVCVCVVCVHTCVCMCVCVCERALAYMCKPSMYSILQNLIKGLTSSKVKQTCNLQKNYCFLYCNSLCTGGVIDALCAILILAYYCSKKI